MSALFNRPSRQLDNPNQALAQASANRPVALQPAASGVKDLFASVLKELAAVAETCQKAKTLGQQSNRPGAFVRSASKQQAYGSIEARVEKATQQVSDALEGKQAANTAHLGA